MSECWNYLGPFYITQSGFAYGRYKSEASHRLSYETFKGKIPKGLTIDHLCRNTICINPDHLEAVTLKENILRGTTNVGAVNARKKKCYRGHAFDKNRPNGARLCSQCMHIYNVKYHFKNRQKRLAYDKLWRRRKNLAKSALQEGEGTK